MRRILNLALIAVAVCLVTLTWEWPRLAWATTGTFGKSTDGASTEVNTTNGQIYAQRYALSESGTATSISVRLYHAWGAGYNAQFAIYDNSSPRNRVAYTASAAVPASVADLTINVASASLMPAGNYWICLNIDSGYAKLRNVSTGADANYQYLTQAFNATPGAGWPTTTSDFADVPTGYKINFTMYVTYETPAVTSAKRLSLLGVGN